MFNAVLKQIHFESQEDEKWYTADRLRRQVIVFFCLKKNMLTDWISEKIRSIYGWCDKDSEKEPGPFSIKSYLQYMLQDGVWGDFIVLTLISVMWGVRVTVVRGDSCSQVRIRHNYDLNDSDRVLLFNGREVDGHYSAVSRVDQSKLKSTSISYTKDFDNGVDTTEVNGKFHRLEYGTIIVKGDLYASLVVKGEESGDVKEDLERVKRENKKIRKILRQKKKLI